MRLGVAALVLALVASLSVLSGCADQPGRVPDSMLNFDRTFDAALGALVDQKMVVTQQDRRRGTIEATAGKAGINVTLSNMLDGTIRVNFDPQGDMSADPGLLQRVTDSYNQRMSGARILPGGLL